MQLLQSRCCRMYSTPTGTIQHSTKAGIRMSRFRFHVAAEQTAPQFPVMGERLQKLLSNPLDLVALGPRVTLAAALSIPETTQTLQLTVTKLQELTQDPRPIEVKGEEFIKSLEGTLVDYAERGKTLEGDLVKNATGWLPDEVRTIIESQYVTSTYTPEPETAVVVIEEEVPFDYSTFSSAAVAEDQAAAELQDLKMAVGNLKDALNSLNSNADPMKESMLKLNVREARDGLSRRLQQLSPSARAVSNTASGAAIDEANNLLNDVNSLRL